MSEQQLKLRPLEPGGSPNVETLGSDVLPDGNHCSGEERSSTTAVRLSKKWALLDKPPPSFVSVAGSPDVQGEVMVTPLPVSTATTEVCLSGESLCWEPVDDESKGDAISGGNKERKFSDVLEEIKSSTLLVEGSPGVGKTNLVRSLLSDFESKQCLQSFSHILYVNTSDVNCCEAENVDQLVGVVGLSHEQLSNLQELETTGKSVLIFLDHCNDLFGKLEPKSVILSILERDIFPLATIVLTARNCDLSELHSRTKVDYSYKLIGFSDNAVKRFIRSKVPSRYYRLVITYLEQNDLLKLCENPLVCSVVLRIFQSLRYKLPKTLTGFVHRIASGLVEFYLDADEKATLSSSFQLECLPESAQIALDVMCLLAMEHLVTGHKCTNLLDSQQFLSSFSLNLSTTSLKESFRFGLVEMVNNEGLVSKLSSTKECAYQFLDPSIMEFLAALHLHKLPPQNQLNFLARNAQSMLKNGFSKWLKFYYGFTGEEHMQHVNFNPTKLMISTVTDMLVYVLELTSNYQFRYTLIECLHEAQEPSMLRKLASKHPPVLTFSVRNADSALWKGAVSTLINKSGSAVWHVKTSAKNEATVSSLKQLTPKVTIISDHNSSGDDETLVISPKLDSSGVKRVQRQAESSSLASETEEERKEKLNAFSCRAVRDIFQRILPLYSKVKLKGDSSNVSYVSFLSCKCFKERFEEFVTLCPLLPVHFLDVPPKKKTSSASQDALTETERHVIEDHEGHAMEVVILLKPFLRKIQFVIPDTNEEHSVVISGEMVSEETQDSTQESVSVHFDGPEIAIVRCFEDYVHLGEKTEIVAPCLPVVQRTGTRTQAALPSAALPPATIPSLTQVNPLMNKLDDGTTQKVPQATAIHQRLPQTSTTHQQLPQTSTTHQQLPHKSTTHQQLPQIVTTGQDVINSRHSPTFVGTGAVATPLPLSHFGRRTSLIPSTSDQILPGPPLMKHMSSELSRQRLNPSIALTAGAASVQPAGQLPPLPTLAEQAVGEVQSSRKQTGLQPGTVLFTSVPDRIPSDRLQTLPNEQHLIRRGGNGFIYSENVSGMAMAIKRTSYRSKEYAIITKLRHKNIMPLLAFVWGPESAENRRRYIVYHYLPKLTGDLARMVTDKEELSMSEFHKRHRHNPRVMGVATGNLKYILSQVLEGLGYMHSIHIAHRDVKASNVLLKFFCGCETPLLCGCDVKYQVVLCDFDAAIELTNEDRIPPTPTTQSHSHTPTPPLVQVIPVGTNGFRAPECSMPIVADSSEALSPQVTTKCDIYSFGILSLRLMIATDTPHSQREMAIMLLHYFQERRLREGRISSRRQNFLKVEQGDVDKLLKLPRLQSSVWWFKGAYDFVRQCVSTDPDQRPAANELLEHPFLRGFPS